MLKNINILFRISERIIREIVGIFVDHYLWDE